MVRNRSSGCIEVASKPEGTSGELFEVLSRMTASTSKAVIVRGRRIEGRSGGRRSRRRVWHVVSQPMYPVPDCLMSGFHTDQSKNRLCLSTRTTGRVETDGEHPDGRRRPLALPTFKSSRV